MVKLVLLGRGQLLSSRSFQGDGEVAFRAIRVALLLSSLPIAGCGTVANVAKAAELLDFVTMPRRQVVLEHEGHRFVKASPADRKAIWRDRILQLRLFRVTQEMLHRAGGPIDSEVVRETLILNLPEENYEKEFATFVDWTRYGDLFAYDETTGQISMP